MLDPLVLPLFEGMASGSWFYTRTLSRPAELGSITHHNSQRKRNTYQVVMKKRGMIRSKSPARLVRRDFSTGEGTTRSPRLTPTHVLLLLSGVRFARQKWGNTKEIMNNAKVASMFHEAAKEHHCEELYDVRRCPPFGVICLHACYCSYSRRCLPLAPFTFRACHSKSQSFNDLRVTRGEVSVQLCGDPHHRVLSNSESVS